MTIKASDVNSTMLDPTWAATNNPFAAPAIASPMRSRTWADFLTEDRVESARRLRRKSGPHPKKRPQHRGLVGAETPGPPTEMCRVGTPARTQNSHCIQRILDADQVYAHHLAASFNRHHTARRATSGCTRTRRGKPARLTPGGF